MGSNVMNVLLMQAERIWQHVHRARIAIGLIVCQDPGPDSRL